MRGPKRSGPKSMLNWLGLASLIVVVGGLVYLSSDERPANRTQWTLPEPSPTVYQPAATPSPSSSFTPPRPDSPLSEGMEIGPALSPLPSPTTSPPDSPLPPGALQLTLLHTNDTWGYLLPCG